MGDCFNEKLLQLHRGQPWNLHTHPECNTLWIPPTSDRKRAREGGSFSSTLSHAGVRSVDRVRARAPIA